MFRRFVVLLLLQPLLSGCIGPGGFWLSGYDHPIDPSASEPKVLATKENRIQRLELRQKLGVPVTSSSYWGFDLFRVDVEQDTSMLLTWLGLPFAEVPMHPSKDHSRYVLVSYDESGQSKFLESGIVLNRSWRTNPIGSKYASLFLRAGEVLFFVDYFSSPGVSLLATPKARDLYISHARLANQCAVILGCGSRGCPNQLAVDETQIRELPLRFSFSVSKTTLNDWLKDVDASSSVPWFEALDAITLDQGEHVLAFSAQHFDGIGTVNLSCKAGTVSYIEVNPTASGKKLVDWQIKITEIMPPQFSKRPLLLMSNDQWYVDQEPKN